jgi:hypothetical protein
MNIFRVILDIGLSNGLGDGMLTRKKPITKVLIVRVSA